MLPSQQETVSLVADAAFGVTCSHSNPAKHGPQRVCAQAPAVIAEPADDMPSVFADTTPAALSWRTAVPCQWSPGDHRRLWQHPPWMSLRSAVPPDLGNELSKIWGVVQSDRI